VREPQYVCIATWMGYEDHESMHDIAGQSGLIYGGTLPAKIFARTFEILRQIQADRKARLAGQAGTKLGASPSASPTRHRRRRSSTSPAPRVQATPAPTPRRSAAPQPSRSPAGILPSSQAPAPAPGGGARSP
jgi:hypothetical protein